MCLGCPFLSRQRNFQQNFSLPHPTVEAESLRLFWRKQNTMLVFLFWIMTHAFLFPKITVSRLDFLLTLLVWAEWILLFSSCEG